jgi:urease accessory protein
MHVIHRMLAPFSVLPSHQQIVLPAERRQFLKRRWRGRAEDGTEFGFDLEERLVDGGLIHRQDGMDYVVRQLPETVFRVSLVNPAQAALVAWKTGNLHMPVQIGEGEMFVLHDDAMRQMLERERWAYEEVEVLFSPLRAMPHT